MNQMTAAEFRDAGYLQEVNRQFFHPLGLAMFVDLEAGTFGIYDDRADPEGWYYGSDLGPKAEAIAAIEAARRPQREAALGYWVQPAPQASA